MEKTTRDIRTYALNTQTLSPLGIEGTVQRLCWVCMACAALIILSAFIQRSLQPDVPGLLETPRVAVTWLAIVLVALSLGTLRHLRVFSYLTILKLGVLFELVVAFAISFDETSQPMHASDPVLGVSKVALWIAVVGLLIPNKPWIRLAAALASATMWPLAYGLNLWLWGAEPFPPHRLLVWIHVPYLMALVTYGLSRRIYRMEKEAQKGRDLGSYDLVSLIGAGGMGEVWRARHRMLARDAAIKLIRDDLMIGQPGYQSEATRRRFKQEAQAIASLQSPHTVYLFDFGVSQDGSFYYVMELLDGISLQMLVDQFGPQPAARVAHILRQVCESLEEAHRQGLVHRDIKPSNIFACNVGIEYDFVKVLDFGLVKKIYSDKAALLTTAGVSAGTPAYMAPEIALGDKDIDGRVDLYGLGCVAYFLLTGSPVFEENTATATALAHVQKQPIPPSQRSEMHVPADFEQIILRCLSKKPDDRPCSAHELSELLTNCSVPAWTQESAAEWWETYLPESCTYRKARRCRVEESTSSVMGETVVK